MYFDKKNEANEEFKRSYKPKIKENKRAFHTVRK